MSGPWEKYQQEGTPRIAISGLATPDAPAAPWLKYGLPPEAEDYSPTSGMSVPDKLRAGVGKAMVDLVRGVGQYTPFVSREDIAESRKLDEALMKTTSGKIGKFVGDVGMLALAPGATTIPKAVALGAGMGAAQPSTSTGETLSNIAVGGVAGGVGQGVANRIGSWASQRAANATLPPQQLTAAQDAMRSGYVIPPADLKPGPMTELLSGLSGKIKTAQVASARNQPVTDALARKAIGLNAGDDLTSDVLQTIRNQAAQAYAPVSTAGTVQADKQFVTALDGIASTYRSAGNSFPGLVKNNPVQEMVDALKQQKFDAGDAVEAVKVLRESADKAYRQGDKGLGKATKKAADEVEGMLERHLASQGNNDALTALRDARKLIAKTYTVQKALNSETGSVAAPVLASELKKGRPLSGELLDIARAGQAFPKATQALKEAPKAVSPLDFFAAASTGAATGSPLALGGLGARPLARSLLLSQPYQRAALVQPTGPGAFTGGLLDFAAPMGIAGGLLAADR